MAIQNVEPATASRNPNSFARCVFNTEGPFTYSNQPEFCRPLRAMRAKLLHPGNCLVSSSILLTEPNF